MSDPGPSRASRPRGPGAPETFALAFVLLFVLAAALPGPAAIPSRWRLVGLAPVVAGALLHGWAWRLFRRRGTTVRPGGSPRELVTDGPYRWTRNPMYLAGILILAGLALCTGRVPPLAIPILYGWTVQVRFLPVEERALADRFGEGYERYRQRVRRWV